MKPTIVLREEPNTKLLLDDQLRIGVVLIDRPEKLNSITWAMRWEIMRCVEAADADERVRVIVIKGAGDRAFSAGGDIPQFLDLPTENLVNLAFPVGAPERATKPVIAAIDGHCYGGGFELTLSCDFRVATHRSRFAFPEVTLGAMPGSGGTQRIVRLVGLSRAKAMVMTGEPIDATRAEQWGLVTHLAADGELDEQVTALATRLAGLSPMAVHFAKQALDAAPDLPLAAGLQLEGRSMTVLTSREHFAEGVAAWKEKRQAVFR